MPNPQEITLSIEYAERRIATIDAAIEDHSRAIRRLVDERVRLAARNEEDRERLNQIGTQKGE